MSRMSLPICSLGTQLGGMPGTPESRGAASSASLLPWLATDSAMPPYTLAMRVGEPASRHCYESYTATITKSGSKDSAASLRQPHMQEFQGKLVSLMPRTHSCADQDNMATALNDVSCIAYTGSGGLQVMQNSRRGRRRTPSGSSQGSGWGQGGDSGVGLRADTGQVRGATRG